MSTRHLLVNLLLCTFLVAPLGAQLLTVDVVPGFDGTIPPEGCFPVTVWIQGERGNAPPVPCEVEVVAAAFAGTTRTRRLVTLPGGSVSQAVSLLVCSQGEINEISARLLVRGRMLSASNPVPATRADWHPLLVGLGIESSALTRLPQRSLGVFSVLGQLKPEARAAQPPPALPFPERQPARQLYVGRVRNSLPPENALGYRGVAAVSLDDRPWDTLNERQQNALSRYVRSGGLLVVHGVDINRLQTLAPSGLLPVEPLGLTSLPASAFHRWIRASSGLTGTVNVVRSRPLGGSRVLLAADGVPLVVTAPKGLGQVVFLAFDPTEAPFSSNDVAHALWKRLLQLQVNRFVTPGVPDSEFFSMGGPAEDPRTLFATFVRTLVGAVSAAPAALTWLVAYLGVYTLVLIPMNYLVLRKLDRLQWSWLTLPAIAVLTSAAGYALARQVQTGSHQVRCVTALYTGSGVSQALVEADWVHFSARTARYRLRARVDGTIVETSPRDVQAQLAAEVPQDEPAELNGVPIPLWSARTFHLSGETSLQGAVTVSASRSQNALKVVVRNGTPYTLRGLRIATSLGVTVSSWDCPSGGQREITLDRHLMTRPTSSVWRVNAPRPSGSEQPARNWREDVNIVWSAALWTLLQPSAGPAYLQRHSSGAGRFSLSFLPPSQGMVLAELENFAMPVEITPLSGSKVEHLANLAVVFDIPGGGR